MSTHYLPGYGYFPCYGLDTLITPFYRKEPEAGRGTMTWCMNLTTTPPDQPPKYFLFKVITINNKNYFCWVFTLSVTVLSTFHIVIYLISTRSQWNGTIVIPVLQMRQLRHMEVKWLALVKQLVSDKARIWNWPAGPRALSANLRLSICDPGAESCEMPPPSSIPLSVVFNSLYTISWLHNINLDEAQYPPSPCMYLGCWASLRKSMIHYKFMVPDRIWAPGYAQIASYISLAALSVDIRATLTSSPQLQLSPCSQ